MTTELKCIILISKQIIIGNLIVEKHIRNQNDWKNKNTS